MLGPVLAGMVEKDRELSTRGRLLLYAAELKFWSTNMLLLTLNGLEPV